MEYQWLIPGALAVWRITHLLSREDGPFNWIFLLRKKAGNGWWGKLLDCPACLSIWISVPFAIWLGHSWEARLLLWPAFSATAILLERWMDGPPAPPAQYWEDAPEPPDTQHKP